MFLQLDVNKATHYSANKLCNPITNILKGLAANLIQNISITITKSGFLNTCFKKKTEEVWQLNGT